MQKGLLRLAPCLHLRRLFCQRPRLRHHRQRLPLLRLLLTPSQRSPAAPRLPSSLLQRLLVCFPQSQTSCSPQHRLQLLQPPRPRRLPSRPQQHAAVLRPLSSLRLLLLAAHLRHQKLSSPLLRAPSPKLRAALLHSALLVSCLPLLTSFCPHPRARLSLHRPLHLPLLRLRLVFCPRFPRSFSPRRHLRRLHQHSRLRPQSRLSRRVVFCHRFSAVSFHPAAV